MFMGVDFLVVSYSTLPKADVTVNKKCVLNDLI